MIKLKAVDSKGGYRLLLRFSDGSSGVFDVAPFIEAATEMMALLSDPSFFSSYFIELGALAWPNGFDLSAESLHRRLKHPVTCGTMLKQPELGRARPGAQRCIAG